MNPLLPASLPKCQFTSTPAGANTLPTEGDATGLAAAPSMSAERDASTGSSAAGLGLPQVIDGVPRPRSPDLLRPPAFEPSLAFGDDIASLAQMPRASKTQGLWDAIGHDAPVAAAALATLAHTIDIAREQALLHIASYAACGSVRVQATRHLGDLASVQALDALRELTTHPDRGGPWRPRPPYPGIRRRGSNKGLTTRPARSIVACAMWFATSKTARMTPAVCFCS